MDTFDWCEEGRGGGRRGWGVWGGGQEGGGSYIDTNDSYLMFPKDVVYHRLQIQSDGSFKLTF
jgi:hypothetical protein